jgi:hypothetical protein
MEKHSTFQGNVSPRQTKASLLPKKVILCQQKRFLLEGFGKLREEKQILVQVFGKHREQKQILLEGLVLGG